MRETVIVALSKGKLLDPTIKLFQQAGYAGPDLPSDPRPVSYTHLTLPTNREV